MQCCDVTFSGGFGNDSFDVLWNKCILGLNGESGDDSFTGENLWQLLENTILVLRLSHPKTLNTLMLSLAQYYDSITVRSFM